MTELQIILIVCAVVFVGSLYWWGKKSKNEPIQRAFRAEPLPAETPADEGFEVTPIKREIADKTANASHLVQTARQGMSPRDRQLNETTPTVAPQTQTPLFTESPAADLVMMPAVEESTYVQAEEVALSSRMNDVGVTEKASLQPALTSSQPSESSETTQNQLFALLVLSAAAKFTRMQLHLAMEASRLSLHHDGTYVKQDTNGNIIFRIANVVEPGYFPAVDDQDFESPGVALVLELPNAITPYRAMDEFITVARKVSQNLGAKLYDSHRHLIKESDLKAMREYAQSLTF